ncbi:Receptor-likey region, transmembrane domain-and RING domain-containing protein 2 [Hondaea fermentalgiana]|uniref:Receptor-likey region, transmembrane domain-and RING domain-containing protein 2 n=1 Tax=Hondaea fermentalgiana TaxID=2315210 RepID=A0A2R5GNH0_9STRA|nr:Receptor-likey region, transmembrane domain-and RING domain-containing protein 2 [Hondaea fermentalgiana]|eukprot:GBG32165.1 Receptor-likey region, transmembrane domain-and RING domain-containing protein 2 [Hondaea fermentalgiana]
MLRRKRCGVFLKAAAFTCVTVLAVIYRAQAAGPHVDIRWNVLAGQYFLSENIEVQNGGFDIEVGPTAVQVRGVQAGRGARRPSQHNGQADVDDDDDDEDDDDEEESNDTEENDSNHSNKTLLAAQKRLRPLLPQDQWGFRKLDVSAAIEKASRFRVTVRASSSSDAPPRFRLGLAPSINIRPGKPFYREWMVDNRCLWYLAGRPDEAAEFNNDGVWGAFSQDGCLEGKALTMEVDLERALVTFGAPTGPDSAQFQGPRLHFSLDGFAPISTLHLTEIRDHLSLPQELIINGASFSFETSNFGPDLPLGRAIVQSLAIADPIDACDPFSRDVARAIRGKILFALRGGCDFLDKVLHAQEAGAIAVIVADHNEPRRAGRGARTGEGKGAKAKGAKQQGSQARQSQPASAQDPTQLGDVSEGYDLVIMDHVNRHKDAARVSIPSVFVSNAADVFIAAQRKSGRPLNVLLRGSVDAPAHHGLHWRDHGLSPAVWLGPETDIKVSVEVVDANAPPAAPAICRPLVYLPFAVSEHESLLGSLRGLTVSRDSQNLFGPHLSKRLAAHAQVCEEAATPLYSFASLDDVGHFLVPWTSATRDLRERARAAKLAAAKGFAIGWGLSEVNTLSHIRLSGNMARMQGAPCADVADLSLEEGNHIGVQTTRAHTVCSFVYGLARPLTIHAKGPLPVVPQAGLFGSFLRAPIVYYWHATLVSTASGAGDDAKEGEAQRFGDDDVFAAIGVVAEPMSSASDFWGISSKGIPLHKGRELKVSSSSPELTAALRWTSFAGVLLDLGDMTLTIFTSADHTQWVTFTLRTNADALLPVMGLRDDPEPRFGVLPMIALQAGSAAKTSELATPSRAAEVRDQRLARTASSKCIQAHADLAICVAVKSDAVPSS